MLPNLPIHITVVFILTTFAGLGLLFWILKNAQPQILNPNKTLIGVVLWLFIQGMLAYFLFYYDSPVAKMNRFPFLLPPVFGLIFWLFLSEKGKAIIDSFPLYQLTYFNLIRIPVEMCLFWLAMDKSVPEIMTFAGRNFDILGGITCAFIAYFGYHQKKLSRTVLLVWNFAMLALICNIIFHGLLSTPIPIQQFGFEQPNIALLHYPFIWLPAFLAPMVLLGHLVQIRQLLRDKVVYGI